MGKKDLKRHILLKHPSTHLCMFCLDDKGWSDVFPSQGAYNEHYRNIHTGIIENNAKRRKESNKRQKVLQCFKCTLIFMEVHERERHMFTVHNFDQCKLCFLMGPSSHIRFHIVECHSDKLCYLCCGNSPIFESSQNLLSHLQKCHEIIINNLHANLSCIECSSSEVSDFKSHLISKHKVTLPLELRQMRKRAPNPINSHGFHTFETCQAAPCIILNFLISFGLYSLPVDVGDFLRLVLGSFNTEKDREIVHNYPLSERQIEAERSSNKAFQLSLESKFECKSCFRYSVTKTKEYVIRLDGSETPKGTFQDFLKNYLFTQRCVCGVSNTVTPALMNNDIKYLFVEIDRSIKVQRDKKDLNLYSLNLDKEFRDGRNLFLGDFFEVFGTISYLINEDIGGGHYNTNLFSPKRWAESSMITVHEALVKESIMKPDFDTDVVIVALKRIKSTEQVNAS
ncbi:unnamed protein product [Lepeophtheirus salmonis]|uniref:(salmon louse) hypothetical protein n=1 Tax=Lepeophtheirus salmonis TaxID=72036 RepID=A0A7R8D550_LEPSM|nr:unnamed protein product [Lepeophtheirus salmonis]CAF2977137.1 unnamed protein product [Lepeophtheirus salmonis]